ncbi:uncharacterized protein M421DRAFT_413843 [Didymella exigua CBS 183.55]|uniref:Uncharacterized protein n=1 Tax=Didymella exigua CBS 183.55 TaxID=1150837 RepID=A0A6A5RNG5_9PLEO|nr:uncharacterized protein M421DRAFT_413843 [Didymella exigua CBS 183.55]KAF1929945.1 hypothetical protein M421DRAFT_413843 [Didymella exigua CBS 183.55]
MVVIDSGNYPLIDTQKMRFSAVMPLCEKDRVINLLKARAYCATPSPHEPWFARTISGAKAVYAKVFVDASDICVSSLPPTVSSTQKKVSVLVLLHHRRAVCRAIFSPEDSTQKFERSGVLLVAAVAYKSISSDSIICNMRPWHDLGNKHSVG